MSEKPLISIISVNLNNLEGLKRTMQSVFEQTWQEFEYIVIDGGSKDGSKEYIEQHQEKISYWVSEPDKGIYNGMNKGIKVANGEYLLFLNSGDWLFKKDTLSRIAPEFCDYDFFYGGIVKCYRNSKRIEEKAVSRENITLSTFLRGSLNHQSLFINSKMFHRYGLYDEKLKIVSDWKFFVISMGLNDFSLKKSNEKIAFYDTNGVSVNYRLRDEERKEVINKLIPRSIYIDLINLISLENKVETKRHKMFLQMESNKILQKINSILFRILLILSGTLFQKKN